MAKFYLPSNEFSHYSLDQILSMYNETPQRFQCIKTTGRKFIVANSSGGKIFEVDPADGNSWFEIGRKDDGSEDFMTEYMDYKLKSMYRMDVEEHERILNNALFTLMANAHQECINQHERSIQAINEFKETNGII